MSNQTLALSGKIALVTGASKGIGASIAKHLAAAGASVVVNYASSKPGADKVVAEITAAGGKAVAIQGDVAKPADITRLLADQSAAQDRALTSARRAAALAQTRFDSGYVAYFEVIDAQRTALATERAAAQLAALRLNTSVALIKALGGGWSARPSS